MIKKPRTTLVVIDPHAKTLSRYQGKHRTHVVEVQTAVNTDLLPYLYQFRSYPDSFF